MDGCMHASTNIFGYAHSAYTCRCANILEYLNYSSTYSPHPAFPDLTMLLRTVDYKVCGVGVLDHVLCQVGGCNIVIEHFNCAAGTANRYNLFLLEAVQKHLFCSVEIFACKSEVTNFAFIPRHNYTCQKVELCSILLSSSAVNTKEVVILKQVFRSGTSAMKQMSTGRCGQFVATHTSTFVPTPSFCGSMTQPNQRTKFNSG